MTLNLKAFKPAALLAALPLTRRAIMPVALLVAFVTAVLYGSGEEETCESPVGRSAPSVHSSSRTPHGLESASWRTPGADAATEDEPEDELEPGYTTAPPDFIADDTRERGIPDEVRERLAREYVGLDIALARPPLDEEARVRR